MTTHADLIARLREWALPDPHDEREVMNAPLLRRAADAIESLEQQVAALTSAVKDAEVVCDSYAAENQRLSDEKDDWYRYHGHVTDELVISQAREAKLRGNLEYIESYVEAAAEVHRELGGLLGDVRGFLAIPTDDSALTERLKQERERMYVEMFNQGYINKQSLQQLQGA